MTTHPDYWNQLYRDEGRPGWDMDGATPLVKELLDLALPLGLRPGCELVVPGCGYGHDAAELATLGFAVTGLDFAPLAIQGRHGAVRGPGGLVPGGLVHHATRPLGRHLRPHLLRGHGSGPPPRLRGGLRPATCGPAASGSPPSSTM
ncbi:MAG: hypothetical protein IPI84_12205 [Holophagaceae bacterium]|nr:hypothetical protein [Holophagaceae bacterium]